jgi:hypothetical protein
MNRESLVFIFTWLFLACGVPAVWAGPEVVCSQVPESFTARTPWAQWKTFPGVDLIADTNLGLTLPGDFSARAVTAWNSKYFFVAVRVIDPVFRPADSMTDFWNGDSIQFAFDPLDNTTGEFDGDDIMLGAGDFAFGRKVLTTLVPEGLPQGIWKVPFETTHNGPEMTYVVALPWRYCGRLDPLRNGRFRFNLIVNDNDGARRLGFLKITDGIGDGPHLSKFRTARFARSAGDPVIHLLSDKPKYAPSDLVRILAEVQNAPAGSTVRLSAGTLVREKAVPAGRTAELVFILPAEKLPRNEVTVKAELVSIPATAETGFFVVDPSEKHRLIAEGKKSADEIDQLIRRETSRGRTADYFRLRLNILLHAFRVAELAQRGYTSADGKLHTYPKVYAAAANYTGTAAPALLTDVKVFAADPQARQPAIPHPDLYQPWTIKEGNLYAGKTPITLLGWIWTYVAKDRTYKMADVGLNFQSVDPGPNSVMPKPFELDPNLFKADLIASFRRQCELGQSGGEMFDILASPHYLPGWYTPGGEGAYAWMDTPDGKRLLDLLYQAHAKAFREFKCIKSYDLANEWIFCNQSPEAMKDFRGWLQRRHGSIGTVNGLWNTSFRSFDEIPKPFDPKTFFIPVGVFQNRGAFWDWCCFNAERAASVVQWMNDTSKKRYPGLLTHIKCIFSSLSHRSLAQCFVVGTDPQRIITITDIIGLDGSYTRGNNWKDTLFSYDYMKSICPDKPIFCSEMHAVPFNDDTAPGEIRRGLFQRFIHGERMTLLFLNTTTQVPEWWGNSEAGYDWNLSAAPAALEAYGTTSADLQRLAGDIGEFNRRPVSVFLFYDNAADFGVPGKDTLSGAYYDRLKPVYESLLYQDVRVGVVTEASLAKKPPQAPWIVLAGAQYVSDTTVKALKNYILQPTGGKILWLEQNLQYDPYGKKRNPKLLAAFAGSNRVIRLRLSPLLLNNLWPKVLNPDFTVADKSGKPVWGVEIKSVSDEKGRPRVFLANTNSRPVELILTARSPKPRRWIDLISGREVRPQSLPLAPNGVLLLQGG